MIHDDIPVYGRLRWEDHNLKFIPSDTAIVCLKSRIKQ